MQKYTKSREVLLVFLFFFILTTVFFRTIIFSKGIIVGHDWMLPYNSPQMERYIEHLFYTWTYDMNLFGVKNPFFVQMPFILLTKIFLVLGLNGELLSKTLLILVFTLSGLSMFLLLRYLRLNKTSSVLGGFILITMPVFFDYTVMGWLFVLFSIGVILPICLICFIKSIEENNTFYSMLAGLLFSIAILQSQSLVWYPMVFLALSISLIKDRTTFVRYFKSSVIVMVIALSLHASWIPNLFIYRDSGVINSDLALDSVSLGMRSRLSYVNILRGWGGLFNYHYEISYPKALMSISFLIPFLAFASIMIKIKNQVDIRFGMTILITYMFILYSISPQMMSKIPFSNIIRDTGRFTALTSFAFTVLASYFINFMFRIENKKYKILTWGLVALIIINATPFLNGELWGEPQRGYDVRLRNYVFPYDYTLAESFLYTKVTDSKVYYPPSGTNIGIIDKTPFFGDFREIKDPFRGYSPSPGTIYMYYSSMGKPSKIAALLDAIFDKKVDTASLKLLGLMNIESVILRDDIFYPENQAQNIKDLTKVGSEFDFVKFGSVKIFSNKNFLPHFYIPDDITYSPDDISTIPQILDLKSNSDRPGIFLGTEREDEVLSKTANVFIVKGSRVKTQTDINSSGEDTRTYEFQIPKDGEYEINTSIRSTFNLSGLKAINIKKIGTRGEKTFQTISINRGTSLKSENDKYIEWGKINLGQGKNLIVFPYSKKTNPQSEKDDNDLILLKNISPTDVYSSDMPEISFERINPTKYKVSISEATNPFVLVFSESYHEGWKIFLDNSVDRTTKMDRTYFNGEIGEGNHKTSFLDLNTFETWGQKPILDDSHRSINGYANSWIIDPNKLNGDRFQLVVEYLPQRNFILGLTFSVITFILYLIYICYFVVNKFYKTHSL
ncbi:MAG: hypothetical protein UX08_C0001G0078 [Candidatus Collierbacteria bacterium GW2011_GWB1_45_35]|uniref:Membrane protein 6-pyruvoyl-tetrahydropterin synthase-related domain-containing protein n=2 Tax=Candidatus Collieribacteriota TaxID=1752725 RepID=A0A0G1KTB1_9BACT|nr:MAG: hypothetical protein UW48_C0003G0075 [Microgenomates group bacterium GW2011_GWC1_44_23]KKT86760.1 MAG: hypothetical protein UW84_C0002G0004 [Candidatus Collierbacteria bacterium GW2011_GWA2_44_99]KKT95940.1 MAG: hypothetical protein UW96_C0003G0075 [Candidatus Collierbacteria bacterium GW2011_GWA1_45_15]KKU00956.1 MAG: hypothetical protein UX01_C0003G0009 [Candidatus Collierbacteria bacterium GW2011_GWB2_45_17]KKU05951.1 MAG: hypothetical protein UX08_C0001G0078 [Candidatus Collierbacte